MPLCPECETALDVDNDEVDEGDVILCDECGAEFEVVGTDPIELAKVEDDYDDDDEDEPIDEDEE